MRRLAVICEVLKPPLDEGVRILAGRLAAALARRVEIVLAAEESSEIEGRPVHGVLTDRWFRGGALRAFLDEAAPDAILYVPWTSLTARTFLRVRALNRRRPGTPVGVIASQPRGTGALIRAASRLAAHVRIFSLGPRVEREAARLGHPVIRLEGGVDTSRFRPADALERAEIRRSLGLPASAWIVLHVGHLKRGRGVMSLAAVQAIEGVQAVLVASSSTEQDRELRGRLRAAGVRVVDRFTEGVEEYYRAADSYLFPTRSSLDSIELPHSVLEAMACNLPVVATRFGGLPGLLDGCGREVRWAASVEEMPGLVAALKAERPGVGLRDRVEGLTWDAMAARILEAFA